jgi:hypothetical protein
MISVIGFGSSDVYFVGQSDLKELASVTDGGGRVNSPLDRGRTALRGDPLEAVLGVLLRRALHHSPQAEIVLA